MKLTQIIARQTSCLVVLSWWASNFETFIALQNCYYSHLIELWMLLNASFNFFSELNEGHPLCLLVKSAVEDKRIITVTADRDEIQGALVCYSVFHVLNVQ